MGFIGNIYKGTRSLVEGMSVTIGHFFRKPVTVEYPRKEAPMSKVQRNAIKLISTDEMNQESHNCIACLQCEKICPSFCIKIEGDRPEGISTKRPTKFDVNYALCSVCGLCLDVCPTNTLGWSKEYDEAGYTREFVYDLLEEWQDTEERGVEILRAEAERKKAEREAKAKAAAEAKKKAEEAKAKKEAAEAKGTEAKSIEQQEKQESPAQGEKGEKPAESSEGGENPKDKG